MLSVNGYTCCRSRGESTVGRRVKVLSVKEWKCCWSREESAVGQGLDVLSPDIFAGTRSSICSFRASQGQKTADER